MRSCLLPSPSRHLSHRNTLGFTLIEVMVVIGIAAILVALAAPDFSKVVKRYQVRQAVEDMTATLYVARSEAIKRGGQVVIQKAACSEAAEKQFWNCGWIAFYDANNNRVLNSGEEVLQRSAKPAGVTVEKSLTEDSIAVDRWGNLGSGLGLVGFKFEPVGSDGSQLDLTTALCVSSGGRIRTDAGKAECD
ncbi:MAG: prepilin-type N-terminal cleavage/methylation domain-containing protein [Alcaligenaceae bacterium]|nr:MAG: prepilin-type N-terminal cleavage/methylation domain-containing protein [Alcaligenaceae bacterium]